MSNRKNRSYTREFAELEDLFKKEVALYQEILSHLSQEEYLLLIGEVEMKEQLNHETVELLKQVKIVQKSRNMLIQSLLGLDYKNLAAFMNDQDASCEELLLLFDQCKTFIKKIKDQKKRNQTLGEVIQNEGALDFSSPKMRAHMVYEPKTLKPMLITIDYPEEKSS